MITPITKGRSRRAGQESADRIAGALTSIGDTLYKRKRQEKEDKVAAAKAQREADQRAFQNKLATKEDARADAQSARADADQVSMEAYRKAQADRWKAEADADAADKEAGKALPYGGDKDMMALEAEFMPEDPKQSMAQELLWGSGGTFGSGVIQTLRGKNVDIQHPEFENALFDELLQKSRTQMPKGHFQGGKQDSFIGTPDEWAYVFAVRLHRYIMQYKESFGLGAAGIMTLQEPVFGGVLNRNQKEGVRPPTPILGVNQELKPGEDPNRGMNGYSSGRATGR